jgi:hypothetical protein
MCYQFFVGIQIIRVLNGRVLGDMLGHYTCYAPNGVSVVDYAMVSDGIQDQVLHFKVTDFIRTLSDAHCKMEWYQVIYLDYFFPANFCQWDSCMWESNYCHHLLYNLALKQFLPRDLTWIVLSVLKKT